MAILDNPPPCFEFLNATMLDFGVYGARVKFLPDKAMTNPFGIVQGGILAGMLDNVIDPAIFAIEPNRPTSTLQMNVHFLAVARAGDEIIGEAKVVHKGKSQVYAEAELRIGPKIIAKATCTNLFLDLPSGT
jgi:acyl-coenzyme A thioesterase 13